MTKFSRYINSFEKHFFVFTTMQHLCKAWSQSWATAVIMQRPAGLHPVICTDRLTDNHRDCSPQLPASRPRYHTYYLGHHPASGDHFKGQFYEEILNKNYWIKYFPREPHYQSYHQYEFLDYGLWMWMWYSSSIKLSILFWNEIQDRVIICLKTLSFKWIVPHSFMFH